MASFYDRHIMPRLIACACSSPAIASQRKRITPRAFGRVLELGVGGGLNLAYYDPQKVERVTGVDPSPELRARALAAPRPDGLAVDVVDGAAESLPFEDARFDSVLCTFTLCSVSSMEASVAEARRVLKPGGSLFFCEHGLAPDASVAVWQRRIDPIWSRLAGGCHLTREAPTVIGDGGFTINGLETRYMPKAPRFAGWVAWGEAVRA